MKTFQKFDDLEIFNNSSIVYMRKSSSKIVSWITILTITIVLSLIIIFFYRFELFNIYYAKVYNEEDGNYVIMNVDEEFINMKNRNYLLINDEDMKCHLSYSSDNYMIYENKKYWEVSYNCELPDELNVNNNIVKVKLNIRKTTLFKEFIRKMKRGIESERVRN